MTDKDVVLEHTSECGTSARARMSSDATRPPRSNAAAAVEFNSPITAVPVRRDDKWAVVVEWWSFCVDTGEDRKFTYETKWMPHHPSRSQMANAIAEAVRHEAMEQLGLDPEHG